MLSRLCYPAYASENDIRSDVAPARHCLRMQAIVMYTTKHTHPLLTMSLHCAYIQWPKVRCPYSLTCMLSMTSAGRKLPQAVNNNLEDVWLHCCWKQNCTLLFLKQVSEDSSAAPALWGCLFITNAGPWHTAVTMSACGTAKVLKIGGSGSMSVQLFMGSNGV